MKVPNSAKLHPKRHHTTWNQTGGAGRLPKHFTQIKKVSTNPHPLTFPSFHEKGPN